MKDVDYLLAKLDKIKEIFDEINTFREFSDAFYCQEHLIDKFFKESSVSLHNYNLFDIDTNGDWKIVNILDVECRGEKFNFVLEPLNGKYEFYKIPIGKGECYKQELKKAI